MMQSILCNCENFDYGSFAALVIVHVHHERHGEAAQEDHEHAADVGEVQGRGLGQVGPLLGAVEAALQILAPPLVVQHLFKIHV